MSPVNSQLVFLASIPEVPSNTCRRSGGHLSSLCMDYNCWPSTGNPRIWWAKSVDQSKAGFLTWWPIRTALWPNPQLCVGQTIPALMHQAWLKIPIIILSNQPCRESNDLLTRWDGNFRQYQLKRHQREQRQDKDTSKLIAVNALRSLQIDTHCH